MGCFGLVVSSRLPVKGARVGLFAMFVGNVGTCVGGLVVCFGGVLEAVLWRGSDGDGVTIWIMCYSNFLASDRFLR